MRRESHSLLWVIAFTVSILLHSLVAAVLARPGERARPPKPPAIDIAMAAGGKADRLVTRQVPVVQAEPLRALAPTKTALSPATEAKATLIAPAPAEVLVAASDPTSAETVRPAAPHTVAPTVLAPAAASAAMEPVEAPRASAPPAAVAPTDDKVAMAPVDPSAALETLPSQPAALQAAPQAVTSIAAVEPETDAVSLAPAPGQAVTGDAASSPQLAAAPVAAGQAPVAATPEQAPAVALATQEVAAAPAAEPAPVAPASPAPTVAGAPVTAPLEAAPRAVVAAAPVAASAVVPSATGAISPVVVPSGDASGTARVAAPVAVGAVRPPEAAAPSQLAPAASGSTDATAAAPARAVLAAVPAGPADGARIAEAPSSPPTTLEPVATVAAPTGNAPGETLPAATGNLSGTAPATSGAGAADTGSTEVAALAPQPGTAVEPATGGAGGRSERLSRFLAQYETGDCMLALPAGTGSTQVAIDAFAVDPSAVEQLGAEFEREAGMQVSASARTMTEPQCSALSFARSLAQYPNFPLRLTLRASKIASGALLEGLVSGLRKNTLYMLIVDDEGKAQLVETFEDQKRTVVKFGASMTLTSGPVASEQLLVAIASDGPLKTLPGRPGVPADEYFSQLASEIVRDQRSILFGITSFVVR